MKETLYYYVEEGSSKGPVTAVQLAKLITPDTLVWTEGMSEWVPANKIEEVNKAMAEVKKDVKIPEPPAGPTPEADPVIQPAPQKNTGLLVGFIVMAVIAVAAIGYIIYDKNYSTPPHIDIDFDSIAAIENADSASVDSVAEEVAEEEAANEIYASPRQGSSSYYNDDYYDEDYYADSAAVDW